MSRYLDRAPKYELRGGLGEGGMGVVYLGAMTGPAGERMVAIKRLAERHMDDDGVERLVAEARLVFRLTHANVCQVLDLAADDEGAFIVMEHVAGVDLGGLLAELKRGGRHLEVASAVHIARDIARALDYAHRRTDERGRPLRLVHGDVKPQNILLSSEGEVKLTDFGIARALGNAPGQGLKGGTPGYMAPEVADGVIDQRADIYSLGATLVTALSGSGPTFAPGALRALRPEITGSLEAILERATARSVARRFQSAEEMESALALELARGYPSYTPSVLGTCVRRSARVAPSADALARTKTVTSLSYLPDAELLPASVPRAVLTGLTRTRHGPGPGATRRLVPILGLAAVLAVAGGVVIALWPAAQQTLAGSTDRVERAPVASPSLPAPPTADPNLEPSAKAVNHARPPAPTPKALSTVPRKAARAAAATPPARPAADQVGHISVSAEPWGAVYIDGRRVAEETPAYRLQVSAGKHEVKVFYPDRAVFSRVKRVDVKAGKVTVIGFER